MPMRPLIALLLLLPAAPAAAQDDFLQLPQAHSLTITVAQLTANDTSPDAPAPLLPPTLALHRPPVHGVLTLSGSTVTYRGNDDFFGLDHFSYSWRDGWGQTFEADVYLLVVPWIVPIVGPMPGSGSMDGVGYYNSVSGTFYLCPRLRSWPSALDCSAYRYPGAQPGWIPVWGDWASSEGRVYAGRPGLYDPSTSTFHLLDFDGADTCPRCSRPGSLVLVESSGEVVKPGPRVPVAVDLDGDGLDSLVFFDLRTRTFSFRDLAPSLRDERLWPLAVPASGVREATVHGDGDDRPGPGPGPDGLAVYSPSSGRYEAVTGGEGVRSLGAGVSSLATARRLGDATGAAVILEIYEASLHGLALTPWQGPSLDDCIPSGTQLLQFPSDPDPPPGGRITQGCEDR